MLSKVIFFSLTFGIFSTFFGMDNNNNKVLDLIEQYKPTFPDFVKDLHRDLNVGKKMSILPLLGTQIQKHYESNGGEGNVKDYIQFLKRFFEEKNKATRHALIGKITKTQSKKKSERQSKKNEIQSQPGTFGNEEHQKIIDTIWNAFEKDEQKTLSNLQNSIHYSNIQSFNLDASTQKEEVCDKVLEQENGDYKISNEVYFAQTVCILFVIHVFQNKYRNTK